MHQVSPDVTVRTVEADDEFLLLACDGIWDCLTSAQARAGAAARASVKKSASVAWDQDGPPACVPGSIPTEAQSTPPSF